MTLDTQLNFVQHEDFAVLTVAEGDTCFGLIGVCLAKTQLHSTHREAWDWTITDKYLNVVATSADCGVVNGPAYGVTTSGEIMNSLLAFLVAFEEARSYGPSSDNYDLFNDAVLEWMQTEAGQCVNNLHWMLADVLAGGEHS